MGKQNPGGARSWKGAAGKRAATKKPGRRSAGRPSRGSGGIAAILSNDVWTLRIYIGIGLLLLGILTYLLLGLLKTKTELIAFAVTDYAAPAVPNAWATEDIESFGELTDTFSLRDISAEWSERETGRKALRDALGKANRRSSAVVIYVSALGLVNDAGEPCLLPPQASPLNQVDFLRVSTLLDEIASNVPDEQNVLLVLDTSQVMVDWGMGVLYNTFTERLEKMLADNNIPKLSVLCSASAGQERWSSPEMQGTVFGQFFQLGVAGNADGAVDGKRDRNVSLHELEAYLQQQVGAWSLANRGEAQTPRLLTRLDDHTIARKGPKSSELWNAWKQTKSPKLPIASDAIVDLWKKLDDLQDADPVRYAPKRWRSFEYRLLRMEQLARAGSAYADEANRELAALGEELVAITKTANDNLPTSCFVDHWRITDNRTGLEGMFGTTVGERSAGSAERVLPTIPLNEYFGLLSEPVLRDANLTLDRLTTPLGAKLTISSRQPESKLEACAVLSAAQSEDVASLWNSNELVRRVLESRRALERLAVPFDGQQRPGDERSHYFVRAALEATTAQQRELEDVLFLGEQDAAGRAEELEDAISAQIPELNQLAQDAAWATRASHQAWATLPYLADWVCRQHLQLDAEAQSAEVDRLVSLIDRNRQLGLATSAVPMNAELAFLPQARIVESELSSIRKEVDGRAARLSADPAANSETYRGIVDLLRLPLIASEQRGKLLGLLHDVRNKLQADYVDKLDELAAKPKDGGKASGNDRLRRLSGWTRHPLVAILLAAGEANDGNPKTLTDWELLESRSRDLRGILASYTRPQSKYQADLNATKTDLAWHRSRLVEQEQSLRSVLPVTVKISDRTNPIADLRKFDVKQLLVWHRGQLIDGMWRAAWDTSGRAYFRVAADDCQRVMRDLRASNDVLLEDLLVTQLNRQDEKSNAHSSAQLRVEGLARPSEDGSIQFRTTVSEAKQGFAGGRAAIFAEKRRKRMQNLQFGGGAPVPFGESDRVTFDSRISDGAEIGGELNAIAFFRGRRFETELTVDPFDGFLVDYAPHRYGPPSIKLSGELGQRASFVFLLDCSNSMKSKIPLTDEQGAKMVPKLDEAKRHLGSMLERLAETDTRVGVKFIGHRVGYYKGNRLLRSAWAEDKEQARQLGKLIPAHDVETIHDLGNFDLVDASAIRRELRRVMPWGVSPLYLAVNDAFREFRTGANERQGIIAITDGMNQQEVIPADQKYFVTGKTNVQRRDVIGKVPVHLIDFATGRENAEFRDIADTTGGSYISAKTGEDLLRAIEKELELDGYYVNDLQSGRAITERDGQPYPKQLNDSVRFSPQQFTGERYEVVFRKTIKGEVKLEGGEALALEVYDPGSTLRIRSEIYPNAPEDSAELYARGDRPTGIRFDVQRPVRIGDFVDFSVSIQSLQKVYTQRPLETWLEVIPLGDDAQGESYVFYDLNLEPNKPVPELKWSVRDWPDAKRASVRFWCKNVKTEPAQTTTLQQLTDAPDRFNKYLPVKGSDGVDVKFQIEPLPENGKLVKVVQRHSNASAGRLGTIYSVRVSFQTTSKIQPVRISRRFDNQVGIATHEFRFSEADWQILTKNANNTRIEIATSSACKDGAMQLKEPLNVQISGGEDILLITQ